MTVKEKCAYIKGLMAGLEIDPQNPYTKVISEIINVLVDISNKLDELDNETNELGDYVEELDEALGDVEEIIYDDEYYDDDEYDDDEYDDDDDDMYCDDCCDECCGEGDLYEVECPHCKETIYVDEDEDISALVCPACGKAIVGTDGVGESDDNKNEDNSDAYTDY